MTDKRTRVRARATVGEVFKLRDKLDKGASVEALASTALDIIKEAEDLRKTEFYRMSELEEKLGISKQAIYRRIGRGTFPKGVRLSEGGGNNAVGWIKSEVDDWLHEQIKLR